MDLLCRYPWPGNVRELENAIERGVILMRGDQLTEKSLPLTIQRQETLVADDASDERPASLFEAEKNMILQTLSETSGNKSEAARRLGITRKTLQNKLHKYDES
jgi:two-component system response regulator HydG